MHEGENADSALAPGTARRAALDAAIAEMDRGLVEPSFAWRRDFSLILGLDRMLSGQPPRLASGTALRRHQVDALAGQLAALIADRERGEGEEDEEDDDEGNGQRQRQRQRRRERRRAPERRRLRRGGRTRRARPRAGGADAPTDDPGARRRYRFKHPTASGKTIAAAGFVDAARTTGVLILTHRRLLVDQFTRDLTKEGYGSRLHEAVLVGDRTPDTPPLTINTYSWFIKHASQLKADVYGVVVCDEAHTALGEKTSAAIRSLSEPVYIGMTATDQLLQKHVSDVFPAEVADLPLAEAVRRGVVAPLRCIRVRPIASLRTVEIVGGDFDQGQLAVALDLDPLNMAAADLYQSRFGDTPGIVYAAGVDHAERVAAAMKAIGMRAAAVSGRTPPRVLAETLAAYERGEINVLVNAMLLAEGWNAPRATVCMHLAPTASRRVYQQRVGRIMRLHRRKESGIVVDFAEPGAPHTERVITLHSLLDVDAYRPSGLVTPPPPRRRRWRRRPPKPIVKEASWIVPVSDNPERRIAVIANQWRLVDASKLPIDEQRAWAVVAARAVTPADAQQLAERIAALQPESRELFLFTCAAENKHRKLRLAALGDLSSQRPSQTTFAMACRLVEAAPTWQQDRGPGCARAAAGHGRRQDRCPDRPDRGLDVAAGAGRPRPRVPLRGRPCHRRPQPAGRAGGGLRRQDQHRGGRAAGHRRHHLTARGRRCHPRRRLPAPQQRRRTAGGARPRGAVPGSAPAGRCAGLEHPGATAQGQAGEAGQGQGEVRQGRDRLVQRRRRRRHAAGRAGEARGRPGADRDPGGGRGAAARRRRPGGRCLAGGQAAAQLEADRVEGGAGEAPHRRCARRPRRWSRSRSRWRRC